MTPNLCMFLSIIFLVFTGCDASDFAGTAANKKNNSSKNDNEGADNGSSSSDSKSDLDFDENGTDPNLAEGDDNSGAEELLAFDDEVKWRENCWFAVSGYYIGDDRWNSVFPLTTSGNKITSGEKFDTAGGVFLNARDEPYVYGEGEKFIDQAVNMTFDGFIIAPDMEIEILNGTGASIYKGKGPKIVESNDYGNNPQWFTLLAYLKANKAKYPDWMQKHLEDINFTPERTTLHAARSVKVTKIAGSRCDSQF